MDAGCNSADGFDRARRGSPRHQSAMVGYPLIDDAGKNSHPRQIPGPPYKWPCTGCCAQHSHDGSVPRQHGVIITYPLDCLGAPGRGEPEWCEIKPLPGNYECSWPNPTDNKTCRHSAKATFTIEDE